MAIPLSCFNLIIPRHLIEKKYPGGWQQCLYDHSPLDNYAAAYDDNLFRISVMNTIGMGMLLNKWSRHGFKTYAKKSASPHWLEVCIVQSMMNQPTLPCKWVKIENNTAIFKSQ